MINYSQSSLERALKEVADSQATPNHKYLAVNNDQFSAVHITHWDRVKRFFGFGETCPKRVAQALLDEKSAVREAAANFWHENKDISPLQGVMDRLFVAAKRPHESINLYETKSANWMQQLAQDVKDKPIHKVLLPGTHDSAAYKVDFVHSIGKLEFMKTLVRVIPFVGKIIANWTVTQSKDLYSQLEEGIRFLDLRVSYDEKNGKFYLTHTFTCIPLEEGLADINRYLKEHSGEVVVLSIESDWEHRQAMENVEIEKEMYVKIKDQLGAMLCPPTSKQEELTLQHLVQENKRVLCYYNSRKEHGSALPDLWDGHRIGSHWIDSSDPDIRLKALKEQVASDKPTDKDIHIASITLTPQPKDIVLAVVKKIFLPWKKSASLETVAQEYTKKAEFLLDPQQTKFNSVNVVATDFPDHAFAYRVFSQN